jgi:hypothetical protein
MLNALGGDCQQLSRPVPGSCGHQHQSGPIIYYRFGYYQFWLGRMIG